MKHLRKVMALVLAAFVALVVATPAFAASITITRDDSYAGTGDGRVYKYYKVFSASYASNSSTGGGSAANGDPGAVSATAEHAAYTATSAVAAKLGTWVEATGTPGEADYVAAHWQKASGNLWFDLTPIAGKNTFSVKWAEGVNSNAADVQAAAAWLIEKGAYEAGPTTLTFANGKWTSGNIDSGYYLVEGATGDNLVAATSDINIKEKNTYPPLDKTQKDEDATAQGNDAADVAVGDVIDYEVKVTIPATAKAGDQILVWDANSQGLSYNDDVAVKEGSNTGNATVDAATAAAGQSWAQLITVTDGSQGTDVVFTFSMTVTTDALIDTGKENTSGLKYGRDGDWRYESTPDKVEYKTYFAGIHKIDGDTNADLAGVKFTLKEAGTAFKVTKHADGYYYPDATNGSSEVVTDSNGLILIRGLDEDKTYTLTETETLPEYNLLASDVTLTLYEDTYTVTTTGEDGDTQTTTTTSFNPDKANEKWGEVKNNKGTVLPSTGGMGTTILYTIGGIMLVGGAIALVSKKRVANMEK